MIRLILTCVVGGVLCFGSMFWYISSECPQDLMSQQTKLTSIEWENDSLNLGHIPYGKIQTAEFKIKNTGKVPLIILNIHPACGCTQPTWDKQPIASGESRKITVSFEPQTKGKFSRILEVHCNTVPHTYTLKLTGFID